MGIRLFRETIMTKKLITEYDYKDSNNSYNIIMISEGGVETMVTDNVGLAVSIQGVDKAMDYANMLNNAAQSGSTFKIRVT